MAQPGGTGPEYGTHPGSEESPGLGGFRLQHGCPDPPQAPGSSIQGELVIRVYSALTCWLKRKILGAGQKPLGPPSDDASSEGGLCLRGVAAGAGGIQLCQGAN